MVTSLVGMHIFAILRNVLDEHLDDLKTVNSKMYLKTIHMLLKNDRSTNELPPLHDPFNNFN
jgi:hypothetical protein